MTRTVHGVPLTGSRARFTWHGLLWRLLPHNRLIQHSPFHPANYEFWYCAWCRRALSHRSWLPRNDPDRWVPYKPGFLWAGPVTHWQPNLTSTRP